MSDRTNKSGKPKPRRVSRTSRKSQADERKPALLSSAARVLIVLDAGSTSTPKSVSSIGPSRRPAQTIVVPNPDLPPPIEIPDEDPDDLPTPIHIPSQIDDGDLPPAVDIPMGDEDLPPAVDIPIDDDELPPAADIPVEDEGLPPAVDIPMDDDSLPSPVTMPSGTQEGDSLPSPVHIPLEAEDQIEMPDSLAEFIAENPRKFICSAMRFL